jgi:aspartate/methionine/tyrosine aminotransferase
MIADRMSRIGASPTLRITAKARAMKAEGIDVIDLSVGEPDFPTPTDIKEAAKRAIDANVTKYTQNDGLPELKKAIARKLERENGLIYRPDEIIVSSGAKNCLYNLSVALFNKGEECIIPAPYWVSYPQQVSLAKADPVIVSTKEENGFRLTPEELRSVITFKTKAIMLNNPNNPSGTAYTREELEPLAEIANEDDIVIIADEIYEKLVYDDFQFTSVAALGEEVKRRAIIVNGVSKAYSMTGWRLGYAAGPKEVIAAMSRVQSHNTSNACSISQMAALAALIGSQHEVSKMVAEFQKRRNYVLYKLQSIPGVSCVRPRGAFYVFPNFSAYYDKEYQGMRIRNSHGLAYYLLKHARVAVVPGDAFGADPFIRISYANSMEAIEEGMARIIDAVSRLETARKVRRVTLSNVMTQPTSDVEAETTVGIQMRDALVAEAETHLGHDNYYEWNVNIGGLIIQLRTNVSHLYDFWIENWYPAELEADLEPHGIIYAVDGVPGREPRAYYNSESKTAVFFNTTYYGQLKNWALGIVTDIAERLFDIHSIRGACLDVDGRGIILIVPPKSGKSTNLFRLLELDGAALHSNDWMFVRYRTDEVICDISERKYYLKTKIARDFPYLVPLFDRSKCENVVIRKDDCQNEACKQREEGCPLDRGEPHCFWAFGNSRAMLDPYWVGGPEKYSKRCPVGWVLLFQLDSTSPPIRRLDREEALWILTQGTYQATDGGALGTYKAQPFYNPYLLNLSPERMELQKRFYNQLLSIVPCYAVNMGVQSHDEFKERVAEIVRKERI